MEVAQGQIGPEAKYAVKFEGGKLRAELVYDGKLIDAGMNVGVGIDEVIEAIKVAIPGKIEEPILEILKMALKAV